jgi:8-oxo-dGTP pyrophosphatase MutT (NUDIX family)
LYGLSELGEKMKEPELLLGIRNCARAVILRDDKLLLLRKRYEDGSGTYVLPGGAQDLGETLITALQRECREEIDTEVAVDGLLYVADFFKPRDTSPVTYRQQVEFFFLCQVPHDYTAHSGSHPDKHQEAVEWVDLGDLHDIELFPSSLMAHLQQRDLQTCPVYLGEIRHG